MLIPQQCSIYVYKAELVHISNYSWKHKLKLLTTFGSFIHVQYIFIIPVPLSHFFFYVLLPRFVTHSYLIAFVMYTYECIKHNQTCRHTHYVQPTEYIWHTYAYIIYVCYCILYLYTHISKTNHLGLNSLCGYLVQEEASLLSQYKHFTHTQ